MLYAFDDVGEHLELLPMAARRALDHAGRRLSREGWQSLSVERRRKLCAMGASRDVDEDAVREALASAKPEAEEIEPTGDPNDSEVPEGVRAAFGDAMPITVAVWSSLMPLDRYALAKVASRSRPERIAQAYQEIVGATSVSTHIGPRGGVRMVDVGDKPESRRVAVASSGVRMSPDAFRRLRDGASPKGDVLGAARLAGIMAAKKTPELIPLCHTIALARATVDCTLDDAQHTVEVTARVEAVDRTGVEMEALVAASVAALTIYDMMKSIDRAMTIGPTRLVLKTGGRSGDFAA